MKSFTAGLLISPAEVLHTRVIANEINESMLWNPQSKEPTFKLLGSKFTADPGTLTALNNIPMSSSGVPSSLFQHFAFSLKCFQGRRQATIFSPLAINSPVKSQQ